VRTSAGAVEVVQDEQTSEAADAAFNARFPSLARNPQAKESVANGQPNRNSPSMPKPPREEKEVKDDANRLIRIFPYGIARTRLERAIREKRAPAYVTNDIGQADAVMAIRSTYQGRPKKLRDLAGRPVSTVVVKSNTFSQIAAALDDIVRQTTEGPEVESKAMQEVHDGIEQVMQSGKPFELSPASPSVRKIQHQVAEARRLASESVGEEPNRRIRLLPTRI
jgi:hypothetical protein